MTPRTEPLLPDSASGIDFPCIRTIHAGKNRIVREGQAIREGYNTSPAGFFSVTSYNLVDTDSIINESPV